MFLRQVSPQRPKSQISNLTTYQKTIDDYTYHLSDEIGVGQFSKVFRGKHRVSGDTVAIKVVELAKIPQQIFMTLLQNEIEILRQINHKNLLKLKSVYQTQKNIYIVTEHYNQGDLKRIIMKNKALTEQQALRILKHLINGLIYLQDKKTIHRDIKPANILVHDGIPKLADFGFAITLEQSKSQIEALAGFNVGTPLYMAPETLFNNQYTYKTDLWAIGCVYFEMLFGTPPFHSMEHQILIEKVKKYQQDQTLPFPKGHNVSNESVELIKRLLDCNPTTRISLAQLVKNPLVNDGQRYVTDFEKQQTIKFKQPPKNLSSIKQLSFSLSNEPRPKSQLPLELPTPKGFGSDQQSLNVGQSQSTSSFPPETQIEHGKSFHQQSLKKSIITRPNVQIHQHTLKFDRCINHLCSYLDQVMLNIQDDSIFNVMEVYAKDCQETDEQEILTIMDFKEKLMYLICLIQQKLQEKYGVQYEKLDQYSNIKWETTFQMMRDEMFSNALKIESFSSQLVKICLFYMRTGIMCMEKYLNQKTQRGRFQKAFLLSIVRLDLLVQCYQILQQLSALEFAEFQKVSNIEKISSIRLSLDSNPQLWQQIRRKIEQLNLI